MLKYLSLTCALTLSAVALRAQTAPVSRTVQTTGMVGIADAQTAQLNLLRAAASGRHALHGCCFFRGRERGSP